jgi:hypothetical protein
VVKLGYPPSGGGTTANPFVSNAENVKQISVIKSSKLTGFKRAADFIVIFLSRRCVRWVFWVRKSEDPSGRRVLDPVRPTWSRALQKDRRLVETKTVRLLCSVPSRQWANRVRGMNATEAESTLVVSGVTALVAMRPLIRLAGSIAPELRLQRSR